MAGFGRDLRRLAAGWRWRVEHVVGTPVPAHFEPDLAALYKRVRRHTLTSPERIAALVDAVRYLVANDVEGDVVECGVWKGGSMMAVALTLLDLGAADRDLHLFDTYTGMTEPSANDVSSPYDGYSMHARFRRIAGKGDQWAGVPAAEVRDALVGTGYPPALLHLVEGKVEDTLPAAAPERLALLRLDTDWYESTRHELEQLYPRLVPGGVLIIDDYGHYEGARRAVDEYLAEHDQAILLNRIDYTGRIAVKP